MHKRAKKTMFLIWISVFSPNVESVLLTAYFPQELIYLLFNQSNVKTRLLGFFVSRIFTRLLGNNNFREQRKLQLVLDTAT